MSTPKKAPLIHAKIKNQGRYKIIDKVSVELDSKKDTYWAKLQNSNIKNANISESLVQSMRK